MAFRLSLLMPVDARLADIIEAGGIRLLRLFISVELFLHDVLRFQKQIDNVGVELHLTSSGFIEQVFHQMRGFLQKR